MRNRYTTLLALSSMVFIGVGCQQPSSDIAQPSVMEERGDSNQPSSQADNDDSSSEIEEVSEKNNTEQKSYTVYSGAYFDIEYPSNFTIDQRVLEGSDPDRYAEVAFISPNKNVEFHVFSPLWGGVAEYETILDTEEVVAEQQSSTGEGHFKKTVDWITVEAKDGSYARSMRIITTNDETVRYLFGITYTSQEALDEYREEYNHFTSSLVQYADA